MTDIMRAKSDINHLPVLNNGHDSAIMLKKPVPLDDKVANRLATQLQTSHPELVEKLAAMVDKINRQAIPAEEKTALLAKEYNLAVKEFTAALNNILKQENIPSSYKNKTQILTACSEQIRNDKSNPHSQVLLDVINKTNICLIGFNSIFEQYKMEIFGLSDDAQKLDFTI